jgi:Domain of unknown function (DUF4832)
MPSPSVIRSLLFIVACISLVAQALAQEPIKLQYAPSFVGNPLKGLVPYAGGTKDQFPHSMEFNYVGLAQMMKGYDQFDWQPMEKLLNEVAGRGHQTVYRIFLEYPGKKDIIPKFLIDDGLKVHRYTNTNTQPFPPSEVETPDYQDKNLRRALKNFIAAMGAKYDGDPRIGFITAGLLGTWGEWHTHPRNELFASKEVQIEVMDAYQQAFKKTHVLLRYPAGENDCDKASNASRHFGYHDDSFAWATLDTGNKKDDWFYLPALKKAGSQALDKWKRHPIGGEIRPEAWGKVFDAEPGDAQIQDFRKCAEQTHASWLMDTGMFREKPSKERRDRAEAEVRRMGYEFHIASANLSKQQNMAQVSLHVVNRGIAPFYYDWPIEYGLIQKNKVIHTFKSSGKLTGLLPEAEPRVWTDEIDLSNLEKGVYTFAVRVPNPLKNGPPLRFANETQDQHVDGWLSIAEFHR